jgi:hypothetical protein
MSESNETDEKPEVFQNRAARRAKGKKGSKGEGEAGVAQGAPAPHGRSAVPGRRQYGNRRTG